MSDYFGALMKSSGLASPPGTSVRSQPPSGVAPDAHADIIELNAMHDVGAPASSLHEHDALPARDAAPPLAIAPAGVVPPVPIPALPMPEESGRSSANDALASAGANAAIGIVSEAIMNSSSSASQVAPRSNAIRAALEWVAANLHDVGTTPGLEARASAARRPSAASARTDPEHIEIEAAQIVRGALPPTPPASQALPASIPEEVVEISIGAIHVRVDAPAPSTTARIAPHEGAKSRSSTARPTTHSALSRRALRRI